MLVSCLCASRPRRWPQLQRALWDFRRQDWPEKELIVAVVDQGYSDTIATFLAEQEDDGVGLGDEDIKVFVRPVRSAQEGLLYALCQARGDLVALWDDDNQNAAGRLRFQAERQARYPASPTALAQAWYYFRDTDAVFHVSAATLNPRNHERCIPSTLMFPRDVLPALDPRFRSWPAGQLADHLAQSGRRLITLDAEAASSGPLHVVGVYGDNLNGRHRSLVQSGRGVRSAPDLAAARPVVSSCLDWFWWDAATLDVSGADGVAWSHTPARTWDRLPGLRPTAWQDDGRAERIEEALPDEST